MKKLILVCMFLFLTNVAFAEKFTFNMTGWDQEKINVTYGMICILLAENNVTYEKLTKLADNEFEIINPSGNVDFVTQENVEATYATWKTEMDINTAIAQAEDAARKTEVQNSVLTNIKLADVDAKIDSLSNLAELKVFLKKLVRYIVAKER